VVSSHLSGLWVSSKMPKTWKDGPAVFLMHKYTSGAGIRILRRRQCKFAMPPRTP